MLWDSSALIGQIVEATDGPIGTVNDLLFDDANWGIRWLIVDTGAWLPGRKVLLPPSTLGKLDSSTRHLPVKLTRQRVKESPDVDTAMPVSRQAEASLYAHYGWTPYWTGSMVPSGCAMGMPFVVPLVGEPNPPGSPDHPMGDLHLRSIAVVTGYHIEALDGEIGHAADFLVDDALWSVRYIVVDTRNWWPGQKVLVSPRSVLKVDWVERVMRLDARRQTIKDSPEYDPALTADGADDALYQTYFGIRLAHA